MKKEVDMTFTKLDQVDLDSPCRELSNGGLGVVIPLAFFREIIFRVFLLGSNPAYVLFYSRMHY